MANCGSIHSKSAGATSTQQFQAGIFRVIETLQCAARRSIHFLICGGPFDATAKKFCLQLEAVIAANRWSSSYSLFERIRLRVVSAYVARRPPGPGVRTFRRRF